jgi:ABC-type sugar transport system permease subunit
MRKPSFERGTRLQYATLVLPGLLIFTVGIIVPMILSLRYSFTSWNGFSRDIPWNGLENYKRMFEDPYVRDAWLFTIEFAVLNTIIQNLFALVFAVILDGSIKGKRIYRTILFMPCLISSIVVGFIWLRMYSNVLPTIAESLGLGLNLRLFGSSGTVLPGFLIANNWQWIGYWMLVYVAALQSVPPELYEAARVDGASKVRQFFKITVPMLAPAFTICIVGISVGSLKVYDLLVSSTGGGPGRASTSIIYLIYNTAISGRQYGYGSALSMTLIVALLVVAMIQISALRKREIQL